MPAVCEILALLRGYPFKANSGESIQLERAYQALPDYIKEHAEKQKEFTRTQIASMSLDEFLANEADIDKALKEGRIK